MLKSYGRPVFATCVMSGTVILNILLDFLFIEVWHGEVTGACLATGITFNIGACCNVPPMFRHSETVGVRNMPAQPCDWQ